MKYLMVMIIFFNLACKVQKEYQKADERLTLLVQDGYFPLENPGTLVIKDAKSLKAFFSKINQTRKPGLTIPEIDFKHQSVLVACIGAVNTSSLPTMYLKSETMEEMTIAVLMSDSKKEEGVQFYPFCVYSIVHGEKKIILDME